MSYIPRFVTKVEKGGESKRVDIVEKVFCDLAKRFKDRAGGYTRIIKFGPRRGDGAPMTIIELVGDAPEAEAAAGDDKKAKTSKKKAKATTTEPKAAAKAG